MTKNLRSLLSLFLAISLLLSISPSAFAEEDIIPIESSDIARLPFGNSNGRLIEAGMTVSYGNGEIMKNAKYLVDGFHFSVPEVIGYSSIDINQNTDSVSVTTPDGQSVDTGTISITEDNNIIEFKYPQKETVKRIELWIWPVGAVKDYMIQYFDGNTWIDRSEGSFDQTRSAADASTTLGKSAVSYIVNFDEIETTGIRFVAKNFKDGITEAKIAEAVLRSSDNVNLLANDGASNNTTSNSWLYNKTSGFVSQASLYAWKFGLSGIDEYKGTWYAVKNEDTDMNAFPPKTSGGPGKPRDIYPRTTNAGTFFWYGISLTKSPQRVNKIAFNTAGTGKISQIEIYQTNKDSVSWPKLAPMPSLEGWTKVATVDCNIAAGERGEIYLPYAEAAEHWLIHVSQWTETPQMCKPEIYVLGDNADFPSISKAVNEVFDTLESDVDSDVFVKRELSNLKSDYIDNNGNEYSVEWSIETDSEDIITKEGETLKIGFHENEETLVLSARLTAKNDTSISYTLSKEYTLLPILNEVSVALSDKMEGNASVLSDGIYFSPYEIMKNPAELPADNYDKMIKILHEGGYIDYSWISEDNISSLNLWIYPQGAVKDWEIQSSEDGLNYDTLIAEGSFDKASISNSTAGCYNVIFEEMATKHMRFLVKSFNEGFEYAYISEAKPGKGKYIDFIKAVEEDTAYSHTMKGYVSSPVNGENAGASKSQTKVWPVKDGKNLFIKPNNGLCWYATGFSVPNQKINRVVIPFNAGGATTAELLVPMGEESGFDYESSDFPACPDTLAEYETIATVRGEFDSSNNVTIDIPGGVNAKYLLIKISGASGDTQIGKPSFMLVDESSLSQTLLAANALFDSLTTDTDSANEIMKKINLLSSYIYDEKDYSVTYTTNNPLLNKDSGEVSYHDAQETVTITAVVKEVSGSDLSYCVSKKYTLIGMQSIHIEDENGENKGIDCTTLNDAFYYVNAEGTAIPKYELNTLVGIEEGDSIVFSWELAKTLTRFEMWNWPIDVILEYSIDVSVDGENWTEHYSGEIIDQFKGNPDKRPALSAPESDYSNFYNIVFDRAAENVSYIRFKAIKLRDGVDKAYILEAGFGETNNVNFLSLGTIKGTTGAATRNSKYVVGNRNSIIGTYAADSLNCLPVYSSTGASVPITPGRDGYSWYATSFSGAPVALNKVTLDVYAGTVYEYEVLYYNKDYSGNSATAGFTWDRTNGQVDPATLADYTVAARVSGEFVKGKGSQIHFDNTDPAKYWLVRVTSASENASLASVGFYQLSKAELSTSCYDAVLDSVFDGVSDTVLSNVTNNKLNLYSSFQMDADGDENDETYFVEWFDNKGLIDTDPLSENYGGFTANDEDIEIELSAHISLSGEASKHVRRQSFILLGKDTRELTTLLTENNIVISENSEKICDSALSNGYEYNGKKIIEISFNKEVSQNGYIQLLSKNEVIAELPVTNGKLVYNGKEITLDSKILLETEGVTFSVSKYGESGYELKLYKESLSGKLPFEKIKFVTNESSSMTIDEMAVKVVSEDLFNAVSNQFDFSKISPSYRATNLNGNLCFVDTIADITLKIESGNSEVVEIDDENNTGIVKSGSTTITATLTNEKIGATHTESFEVISGRDNLGGTAASTSPAVPVDGTDGAFALDGSLETEFLTESKSYNVNINLSGKKAFNKLCVFLPKGATGEIESIKLLKSSDNIDYEAVCTVTAFEDGVEFEVPYTEAQFIRLEINSSGTKTGIRDICIYNDMTDEDKLKYDFKKLTESLNVGNGTIIPKSGCFGTNFTLSSNNTALTIQETEDKTSWKIVAGTVSADTNVTVTLSAQLGALEPLTKSYSIFLTGDVVIGDNIITGDNNNGFGNGSLSGGGGGGSSGNISKDETSQQAPVSGSALIAPSESIDELNNHWAENEIKTLIAKNIVQGDGSSLNLDKNVTRAEFCKMIIVALGMKEISFRGSFSDVSRDMWYATYAETALENNIMSGDINGFRGNDKITRQEVAVVISNLLKNYLMQKESNGEAASEEQTPFTDNDVISEWATEHVALSAKAGIIKGYETGDFKPLNFLKRDEAMVIVYRVLSHIEK